MRKRIPGSLIKRAEKAIENQRAKKHRPVMLVPRILAVDEWSDLASQIQVILKENVVKDTTPDYGSIPKLELVASR